MKPRYFIPLALGVLLAGCSHLHEPKADLRTPESTVVGFTKAAANGDAKLAQSYFLPGGVDYQDIWETLTAEPGTPRYPGRVMLEAVDPDQPMNVRRQEETERGLGVVWQVTFRRGFEIEGRAVEAGAQYDFDATLKKTKKGWLIDGF